MNRHVRSNFITHLTYHSFGIHLGVKYCYDQLLYRGTLYKINNSKKRKGQMYKMTIYLCG